MFLVPPKVSLPLGWDRDGLLSFGDPIKLKDGVVLKEKATEKVSICLSTLKIADSYVLTCF